MTIIRIHNPYFDKHHDYAVVEDKATVEYGLKNINNGNEKFLYLHDYKRGDPITISPACCASIEFKVVAAESEEV